MTTPRKLFMLGCIPLIQGHSKIRAAQPPDDTALEERLRSEPDRGAQKHGGGDAYAEETA
jgi:hypothetical protein